MNVRIAAAGANRKAIKKVSARVLPAEKNITICTAISGGFVNPDSINLVYLRFIVSFNWDLSGCLLRFDII